MASSSFIRAKPSLCRLLLNQISTPSSACMEPFHFNSALFLLLLLVSLSLFLGPFSVSCNALGQCLEAESSALLQLKRGFTSVELDTWQPGTDCCIWENVTCDESRRVIGLDLSYRGISGTIDPSLFNLTSLRNLSFTDNQFYWIPIPDFGWDRLTNLSRLDLSDAGFAGKVPVGIFGLTKLTYLDLSDNFGLFLTINPTFLRNMSSLRELMLNDVNISAYADEWGDALVNSTPVLKKLSMSNCSLFGLFPKKIFQLRDLEVLYISNNSMLSGSLPDFPEDSNLQVLDLSGTNLSGNLPDTIGNLKFLAFLDLSNCQFSGRIPSLMGNLSQLFFLDLSDNNFSGVVELEFIKYLKDLWHLDLSNSGFSFSSWDGNDESWSSLFPQLTFLKLVGCNLTKIPTFIEYPHYMYLLDLSNNTIHGEIPTSICNLSGLQLLDLSMNRLTGSIPPCLLGKGVNFQMLNLKGNLLHGAIPDRISPKCELQVINLRDNKLD